MFGYNVLDCDLVRLSYDTTDSTSTEWVVTKCNRCDAVGSINPKKIDIEVDQYLCDVCAGLMLDDLMDGE